MVPSPSISSLRSERGWLFRPPPFFCLSRNNSKDSFSSIIQNVQLSGKVASKTADDFSTHQQYRWTPLSLRDLLQAPDDASQIIGKQVDSSQASDGCAAIDVTTDYSRCRWMWIFRERCGQSRLVALRSRRKAVSSFHDIPSVILTFDDLIDFFPVALPSITGKEPSGRPIKADSPRISHAIDPNLAASLGIIHKGIVRWNRIRTPRVDIDSQNLAEHHPQVLPVARRVASHTAVT